MSWPHKPTIDILNTHATVLSSKYEVATTKFYELFSSFIKLLRSRAMAMIKVISMAVKRRESESYHMDWYQLENIQ